MATVLVPDGNRPVAAHRATGSPMPAPVATAIRQPTGQQVARWPLLPRQMFTRTHTAGIHAKPRRSHLNNLSTRMADVRQDDTQDRRVLPHQLPRRHFHKLLCILVQGKLVCRGRGTARRGYRAKLLFSG